MVVSNTLGFGGAERFAAGLLKKVSYEDILPRLVLLRPEFTYHLSDDIPVHVLDYHRSSDLPKAVFRLRGVIKHNRPDVILGVSTAVNVVIGLCLATLRNSPAWIAAVDTDLQRRDLRLRKMILKILQRQADFIVAVSIGMQRQLSAAFPEVASNIVRIYYPVDFDEIRALSGQAPSWIPPPGVPLIVAVGRAHRVKRLDILLDAFAKVARKHDAALALCGDGPQLKMLKDKARQLNIAAKVHFLGHCANPFAIVAQADLFVLSSEAEGLPFALMEAQALGLCAVATRCSSGAEEIVTHGQTGLLTDVNDGDALASAIDTLLSDDNRRTRMGSRAKEKVLRQFDFQECSRQWWALIRQAAVNRRKESG